MSRLETMPRLERAVLEFAGYLLADACEVSLELARAVQSGLNVRQNILCSHMF